MPDSIPPKGMGPGRGIGTGKTFGAVGGADAVSAGPSKQRTKFGRSLNGPMRGKGMGRRGTGGPTGKDPSLMKKGMGPFGHGRLPQVDKDGDPFTKRSPWKKPGNNSFF